MLTAETECIQPIVWLRLYVCDRYESTLDFLAEQKRTGSNVVYSIPKPTLGKMGKELVRKPNVWERDVGQTTANHEELWENENWSRTSAPCEPT